MTGLCHEGNVKEDLEGDGFDVVWGWVQLAIAGELLVQPEVDLAMDVKAWVWGSHTKECLCKAL